MISYLYFIMFMIGSIPFGIIWSNLFGGKNIKDNGSGNIGTTNAWRVNGKFIGLLTAVCDISKSFACLLFDEPALYLGIFVVLGHMYGPWSRGKGVAPFFGLMISLFKFLALFPMLTWIIIVVSKKLKPTYASYISLFISLIIAFLHSFESFFMIFILSLLIVKRHILSGIAQSLK